MSNNITAYNFKVTRKSRSEIKLHLPMLVWFTGLSGSGKSTISDEVEKMLYDLEIHSYTLDGDNIRKGLNKDLGFSPEDRSENIRRISEVSNLMLDAGLVVLASFVSPYRVDRESVKKIVGDPNFIEVYINTPVEECEKRDVKGLYAKARKGEIPNMTGISAPYEEPLNPSLEIKTLELTPKEAAKMVVDFLIQKINFNNE